LFRSWATAKGLLPSETHYVARASKRTTLRFSKSGNATIEQLYRTHWISGELSKRKRERLAGRVLLVEPHALTEAQRERADQMREQIAPKDRHLSAKL
jgi:hypothetical protein